MRGSAHISHITGVPGWEAVPEQDYLFEIARALPEKAVIFEIGGEFGMSASIFSKGAPAARIYSVDVRYDGELGEIHKSNLDEAKLGQNVTRIPADSQLKATVAKFRKLEKEPIDLLFIDGDHSIGGALNDLNLWTPLTQEGSLLVLHDTVTADRDPRLIHPLHYDVSHAMMTWYRDNAAEWINVQMVETITAFRRVK